MLAEKIFALATYADQVVLGILLVLSILSIGMILERFFYLSKVFAESSKMRDRIRTALQTNSLEDFESMAKDTGMEGRAAAMALRHIRVNGVSGLEELFSSFMLVERPDLERFLSFLATVANNAVYVGLFGTVLGVMKAFQDLATAPEAGQQTVMAGISMALIATATGLMVAIPAGVFYNYFQKRVKSILHSIESLKELGIAYAKQKAN